MKVNRKYESVLVVALIIALLLVIFLSWIIAAVFPAAPIRSLLSDVGLRWLFGSFTECVMNPLVVWIIVYSMVWGIYCGSGLGELRLKDLTFRKRLALRTIAVETILALSLLLFLTAAPHAILLSVTGSLFTHHFVMSMIPTAAIFLMIIIITYGTITRNFRSVSSITDCMASGISGTSRIWLPYMLIMLLVNSVLFVINT